MSQFVDWIHMDQYRNLWEHNNESSGPIKGGQPFE
jgi:hypothetical protein